MLYPGNPFTCKDTQRLKIKGWRKIYQENGEQKKAGLVILVSDKINLKAPRSKESKKTLHNGKTIDTTRRANYPKYIWTKYRSTQIYKASS